MEMKWLDPNLTDDQLAEMLSFEMPSEKLCTTPVWSIRTTKPRPDGKLKNEYFAWPNLPPLGDDNGQLRLRCNYKIWLFICCITSTY